MIQSRRVIRIVPFMFGFLTVLSLTFCSSNTADTRTNDKIIMTARIDTISGETLERLIGIEVRKKFKERYSGHYEYYSNNDSGRIMHGKFYFFYADSGFYLDPVTREERKDMFWITKISYSGEFIDNKKNGEFIETLLDDDGVDISAEWQVSIKFVNDNCKDAKFTGEIGHMMPKASSYSFAAIDTCSFDNVVNLVWAEWEKEYEKQ